MSNLIFDATPFRCVIIDKTQGADSQSTIGTKCISSALVGMNGTDRIQRQIPYRKLNVNYLYKHIATMNATHERNEGNLKALWLLGRPRIHLNKS